MPPPIEHQQRQLADDPGPQARPRIGYEGESRDRPNGRPRATPEVDGQAAFPPDPAAVERPGPLWQPESFQVIEIHDEGSPRPYVDPSMHKAWPIGPPPLAPWQLRQSDQRAAEADAARELPTWFQQSLRGDLGALQSLLQRAMRKCPDGEHARLIGAALDALRGPLPGPGHNPYSGESFPHPPDPAPDPAPAPIPPGPKSRR
jgi:hypothetical protein